MNRTWRKLAILMLTFCLVFPVSALANVTGGELRDIRGHWAQDDILRMYTKGLINGYPDGTFRPDQAISRIEMVILVNRIFQFTTTTDLPFTDIAQTYQYYSEIAKAYANGYIKGYPDNSFRPNQSITREEAAVMLAAAFQLEPSDVPVTTLTDVESLGDWSRGSVRALVHAGVLKGYPDGTFRAKQPISRAETAKLLAEMSGEVLNQPGIYEGLYARHAVINTSGVVLKNSIIEGNLYLTEGIGEGDVTLDHVTVRGSVQVAGGGANSVHVIDSTIASVVVDKKNGVVRIAIEGDSKVEQVFVITGVRIETDVNEQGAVIERIVLDERMIEEAVVELSGAFGTVEARALTAPEIRLLRGVIGQLVAEQKVRIHVDAEGEISDLIILTEAPIEVTGEGQVTIHPDSQDSVDTGAQQSDNLPSPWTGWQPPSQPEQPEQPQDPTPPAFGNVSVHDPSIIVADGKYYVFGSHIEAARSEDLMRWTRFTNAYTTPGNALFGDLDANLAESFAWAGAFDADTQNGYAVWAPDVIWVEDYDNGDGTTGAYLMYYSVSSTYIRSAIGIAASKTIEGPYEYVDTIIYSGFTQNEAYDANSSINKQWSNTNLQKLIDDGVISDVRPGWFNSSGGYNNSLFPNAIDPTLFHDKDGKLWMTYGSWSGGIFLLEIDPKTGRPIYPGVDGQTEDGRMIDRYFGIKIAGGYAKSGEGPYIFYDPTTDYYYLFVTYGRLDANGEYNMRLFRSTKPEGPYLDASGQNAVLPGNVSNDPYGNKLIGHFLVERLPGETGQLDSWGYVSPGHNSAYLDPDSGKYYLIFHSRFPFRGEAHEVRVHQMFLNEDDWLVVSPYRYAGEELKPVAEADIVGEYRYLNHGKANTTVIQSPAYITLHEDHTITSSATGEQIGTWSKKGDYYAEITVNGKLFKGVFVRGWDPIMERFALTFTALSHEGENIWGMRYADILDDEDVIHAILEDLELGDTSNLTWDLELPKLGLGGTKIEWQSSDGSVITKEGKIHRPEADQPPAAATLTAVVQRGSKVGTKEFHITVKPKLQAVLNARYTFDGDLSDVQGNFAAGTVTGNLIPAAGGQITYADGVLNQAAVFDGNSGIRLPDGLIKGYEYSVALWLKPDQLTMHTTSFFGARDPDNWVSLVPHGWPGTAIVWSGTNWYDAVSDVTLPIGEWTHLAFTVYNGEVHLYVNGELKFSGTNFPHIFSTDNAVFALGVNYWDAPFKGLMDDLRIYDGALTAAEVRDLIVQPEAKVEKIIISTTEVDVYVGEVYKPAYVNVYPIYAEDRSLVWSSSDDAVAAVDPSTGHVRGVAEGTAVITATAKDGSGVTASYTVIVKGEIEPVAYYSFDQTLEDAITGEEAAITGNRPNNTGGHITFSPGVRGQAAVFDGQSGLLLRDDLITGFEYTVTMSVYLDFDNMGSYVYSPTFFGARSLESWISFTPVGHPDVSNNSTLWSGTAWYIPNTGKKIANRTWTDVAFAVNHGVIQIYIDGEIVYSGTGFPDVFKSDSSVFTLGVNYWDPAFKGMIDELRVYDKALNKETIDLIFLEAKMPAPVAHFTFDGNLEDVAHGARAADIIGVERNEAESRYDFGPTFGNGVITYETGVQGQAASFNGESGVMLPAGLIQDNRYTVSLWLNPAQITRYTTTFFAALDGVNWVSFVPEGFQGDAMLWSNMNGTFYDGFTETTLPVNTWTHVAFTVDGGNVRVYINGELKHQGTNFNDVFTGKNPFYTLGVNWWDTPYQGLIDNLRIYDVPLTEEQVQVLYSLRR